jgi:hypothetical protein
MGKESQYDDETNRVHDKDVPVEPGGTAKLV